MKHISGHTSKYTKYTFFYILLFAILAGTTACSGKKKPAATDAALPVEIYVVEPTTSQAQNNYVGEVEALSTTPLSFPLGGQLTRIYCKSHQYVHQGDTIAKVDNTQAISALQSAEALLRQAQDGYNRLKQVYDKGGVAEVQWIEIQTQLQKAQSMADIARKEVANCSLLAPTDGILGECNVQTGQQLAPGQRVVNLMDISQVNICFAVPENEIASIRTGQTGQIEIPAVSRTPLTGKITEKGINGNRLSHSYEVKMTLNNKDNLLMPGMVCKVSIPKETMSGYVIPAHCVQTRKEGLSVWVVRNGKAERQAIRSQAFVQDGVLANEGLTAGDSIITSGYQKLYTGCKIVNN